MASPENKSKLRGFPSLSNDDWQAIIRAYKRQVEASSRLGQPVDVSVPVGDGSTRIEIVWSTPSIPPKKK